MGGLLGECLPHCARSRDVRSRHAAVYNATPYIRAPRAVGDGCSKWQPAASFSSAFSAASTFVVPAAVAAAAAAVAASRTSAADSTHAEAAAAWPATPTAACDATA